MVFQQDNVWANTAIAYCNFSRTKNRSQHCYRGQYVHSHWTSFRGRWLSMNFTTMWSHVMFHATHLSINGIPRLSIHFCTFNIKPMSVAALLRQRTRGAPKFWLSSKGGELFITCYCSFPMCTLFQIDVFWKLTGLSSSVPNLKSMHWVKP